MKFLIWLAIIFIIFAWVMRSKKNTGQASDKRKPTAPSQADTPELMLQCAQCGVHIPASEALPHGSGVVFCSEEHRRQIFPS